MNATPPRPTRRPVRHAAARSRVGVAVGSIAVCVGLTGGLAWQHLSTSASAASPAQITTTRRGDDGGYGDDGNGFVTAPIGTSTGFAPGSGQLTSGANTSSHGS